MMRIKTTGDKLYNYRLSSLYADIEPQSLNESMTRDLIPLRFQRGEIICASRVAADV